MIRKPYFDFKYLRNELAPIFKVQYLSQDIIAGLIVALVAIPLSLAVSLASSVSPMVGLISAIIGSIIAALFGGCTLAITGPAVAMTVIISQCVEAYGLSSLLIIGAICGILQILFGLFRFGRFTKLIPQPVTSAFIAAIGVIIIINQLPNIFDVAPRDHGHLFTILSHIHYYIDNMNPLSLAMTLLTIVLILFLPYKLRTPYALVLAIIVPSLIVYFGNLSAIPLVGAISPHLSQPHLTGFDNITDYRSLFISSLAVFAIASLETLLSAQAMDSKYKGLTSYKPNQELIGQGMANLGVALFGGMPVTGVIARSSVNAELGAKTRRSAIIHAMVLVILVYFFPALLENIPLCVLSAILVVAGVRMINYKELIIFWKNDKFDLIIYLVTFITIVSSDLVDGIQTGLILAIVISAIKMLTTKSSVQLWSNNSVIRISLSGNMSFWSFEALGSITDSILNDQDELQFVIFEFSEVNAIDNTGARHLIEAAQEIEACNIKVIFHGANTEQLKTLTANLVDEKTPFIATVTENDIKQELEKDGVSHLPTDVLRHGVSKFSRYAEDYKDLIDTLAQGQNPHTLLITCSDSRLNPNAFFSASLGELFVVRNVGNVVPPYSTMEHHSEAAAIEFAINGLNIRNIVVCAHTECGAVKASIKDMNNNSKSGLDNWLEIIKEGFRRQKPIDANDGVQINLLNQMKHLKTYPLVKRLLARHQLTVSAWIYDVHSATVLEWDEKHNKFVSTSEKTELIDTQNTDIESTTNS